MGNNYLLEMRQIDKQFSGVHALDHVNFRVRAGEIHALMGENGAGKSTLMKVLTGLYRKDAGEIVLDGEQVSFNSPLDAQRAGISTIYQEINLIPYLSIAENIHLGREPMNRTGINWKRVNPGSGGNTARDGGGSRCNPTALQLWNSGAADGGDRRAISVQAKLIVMDEPTSSLMKRGGDPVPANA